MRFREAHVSVEKVFNSFLQVISFTYMLVTYLIVKLKYDGDIIFNLVTKFVQKEIAWKKENSSYWKRKEETC